MLACVRACAQSGEEAAGELFELLGDSAVEAIGELLEHRCGVLWGFMVSINDSHNYH